MTQHGCRLALLATLLSLSTLLACGGGSMTGTPVLLSQVKSTANPMVAQLTVISACNGQAMVEFGPDTSYGRSTSWYPISFYQPTPLLVAGMQASTIYHMRAQRQCNGQQSTGEDLTFKTGAPPSTPFPALLVSRPTSDAPSSPPSTTSPNPGIELVDTIAPTSNQMQAFFTDLDGNPIWYYDVGAGNYPYTFKPLSNGHILFNITNSTTGDSRLREIDLAGNTIREMDISVLQQKMQSGPFDFIPAAFHHDFLPLANGHLIVLTNFTRSYTDLPGYPGTTQVLGDGLVDLDQNWNPVWAWNAFDYLDVNRHLNGLPDWTHSNAVIYSPDDGNLMLSMRHQSWVLKIDYNNGTGSGNVLWRLGYQGDFTLAQGDDPSLWFSFQHFPSLVTQNSPQTTLAIWDNGDYRPLNTDGDTCSLCYSRATVFQVDESDMVANLLWYDLPGYFSEWGGSINQLANGNIEFDANALAVPPIPNIVSEVQEVTQTSTPTIVWKMDIPSPMDAYRAYRVPSLYPGVSWTY
jgi:arylsulfate sulfotransferase